MHTIRSVRLARFLLLAAMIWISGCASFRAYHQQRDLQQLASSARQTEDEVRTRLDQSPDHILSESLRTLDAILDYANRIKSDPKRFDSTRIEEYTRKIDIIRTNLDRFRDLKLQANISFPFGAYKIANLSPAAQIRLNQLADRIVETAKLLRSRYPHHPIRITLKTVGYTDLAPILSGSSLERVLLKEVTNPAVSEADRQGQYNRALSRLRSVSVNRYLRNKIREDLPGDQIRIELRNIGKGPSLPLPEIIPPYKAIDARRRICVISPFIEIVI